MGCIRERPSNDFNFISAHDAFNVQIEDLGTLIPFCSSIVGAPFLTFTIDSPTSITFNWTDVGAIEYRLIIADNPDFTSQTVFNLTERTRTVTFTNNFIVRYARVRGRNIDNSFGSFSNVVNPVLFNAPSNLAATSIQLESIALSWLGNNDDQETNVRVERSLLPESEFSEIVSLPSGSIDFTDDTPPLDHDTTYYYRVRSFHSPSGLFSDYSNVLPATTLQLAAPTGLMSNSTIYNEINLSWTLNSGGEEDFVSVERSLTTGTGFSVIQVLPSGTESFIDRTGSSNTEYFYRVRVLELQGISDYSNETNLTTGSGLFTLVQPNGDRLSNPNGDILITNDE